MKKRAPSIINYPELLAQKARLGMTVEDLVCATGCSTQTISAMLNGKETLNLQSMIEIARALGLRVKVEFEPMPAEQQEQGSKLKLVA